MRFFTATGAFRAWWSVAMVLVAAALIAAAGFFYTNHVRREADHRWCALLALQARPNPPPSTDRGWAQVEEYRKLHKQFGCEEGD